MNTSIASDLTFQTTDLGLKGDLYLGSLLRQCEEEKSVFNAEFFGWLRELRQKAAYRVVKSDFPTKKDEEWRFTDLAELSNVSFKLANSVKITPESLEAFTLPETQQSCLVFVNGIYAPNLSNISGLPEGVYVGNLANLPTIHGEHIVKYLDQQEGKTEVFTSLNTAGLTDAAVIWTNPNVIVETPIQLIFLSILEEVPTFSQPRTLIVAEKGSQLTIIEQYSVIAEGCSDTRTNHSYFTNAVTEIWVEDNAQINHNRIQRESGDGFHIGKTAVTQSRDSHYTINEINLGGKLSRHNLEVLQIGEQTNTNLNGLTLIGGEQIGDTHSVISLTKPHGTTNQLHKCIADDSAHAIFNGKVFVPKAAQMTNASQLNRNLLLSPKARIDTKPELQITADNVKCSHGATVSQLEAEEVFYLRSRGLSEYDARHLLLDAFAAEILDLLPLVSLRQRLTQCVTCRTID